MVFLVFSRKKMFFWFETIFFSRKRWFLSSRSSKNHLFLEKKMVFRDLTLEKPSFSREKDGFRRSCPGKTIFSREKDGFWRSSPGKTIFFSRKRWFLEERLLKNHLFLEKKMSSVFFLGARLRRDAIIESRPRSILPAGRRFA